MSAKPILHGRDHRTGGADPIPGLGAANLAVAHTQWVGGATPIGPGSVFPTWSSFTTSDSSVFSLKSSDHRYVQSATNGVYLARLSLTFNTQPTSVTSAFTGGVGSFDAFSTNLSFGVSAFDVQDATVGDPKEISTISGVQLAGASGYTPPINFYGSLNFGTALAVLSIEMDVVRLSDVGY